MRTYFSTAFQLVVLVFSTSVAIADDDIDKPLWELKIGAYADNGPEYPASRETETNALPAVFPIYRGKVLRIDDENDSPVTARVLETAQVKLDIDFGLNFPVDSEDIAARTGMPDLEWLFEMGPELEFRFADKLWGGDLYIAPQLRGAWEIDGLSPSWSGAVLSAELKYDRPLANGRTEFKFKFTPEFASSDYMEFFYGVAPQFATGTRTAFNAKSGYLGSRLRFSLKHRVNQQLDVNAGYRIGLYSGAENERSPLYTDSTTTGFFVAFLWKFWESETLVNNSLFDDESID